MKIHINQDPKYQETEVIINCGSTDAETLRLLATLRVFAQKITGVKEGETYILSAEEILYIDTVDKKTFFYTHDDVYETALKLYELEDRLKAYDFFRASKSTIINFQQIKSLRPEFGGRLILTMDNGEQLYVSRQYSRGIKHKLGMIKEEKL